MKLIIDIPEHFYKVCKADEYAVEIRLAVKNGIPLDRVDELQEVSGMTLEEILANFASDSEYPPFRCVECPIKLKGMCLPLKESFSCYSKWLDYLTGKDEDNG